MIRIKKVTRTDQQIVFVFVWKFLREQNSDTKLIFLNTIGLPQKKMFLLSLQKNLQVSKLYNRSGAILCLLKDPLFPDIELS